MDEAKRAEARQLINTVSRELDAAAHAAKVLTETKDEVELWKHLQTLFARFDEATHVLKNLRRTVDDAYKE